MGREPVAPKPSDHPPTRSVITVFSAIAEVKTPHADCLNALPDVEEWDYQLGGRGGYTCRRKRAVVHFRESPGKFFFPAAFWQQVEQDLRARGDDVEVRHCERPLSDGPQPVTGLAGPRIADPTGFDEALAENRAGQIAFSAGGDRWRLVVRMLNAFSSACVNVVAKNADEAMRWHYRLAPSFARRMSASYRERRWRADGISVVPSPSARANCCEVLIYLDIRHARRFASMDGLRQLVPIRYFGFVDTRRILSPAERVIAEAVFGPVIFSLARTRDRLPVQVVMATPPIVPLGKLGKEVTPLKRKQCAVWHNDRRNAMIVDLANGYAESKPELLWKHGVGLASSREPSSGVERPLRVAILVESIEHGKALMPTLPGWRLSHQHYDDAVVPIITAKGSPSAEQEPDPVGPQHRTIFTWMAAHKALNIDVDVVIRADGTASPWIHSTIPPRAADNAGRRILLVDVGDDWDHPAELDTLARLRDYQAMGWEIDNMPAQWRNFENANPRPTNRRSRNSQNHDQKGGRNHSRRRSQQPRKKGA